jgi:hypothetical protein
METNSSVTEETIDLSGCVATFLDCSGVRCRTKVKQMNPETILLILACIVGILLGLYFRVIYLLPVTLAGAAAYAMIFAGQNPRAIIIAIVFSSVCLQAGYMIGLTSRELFSQILVRLNLTLSKRV